MYNNYNSYGASSFGIASQGTSQGAQTSQGFQGNNPQYQGYQKQFQPVGFVQSFYNQPNAAQSGQGFNQTTSQESFHTANYRGNQPGHDAYKRSDSSTPSQQQQSNFQSGYSSLSGLSNQFGSNQPQQYGYTFSQQPYTTSQFGSSVQTNQPYAQTNISPNAFHMANYRGNQPGHDALRAESSLPSQQSFQSNYGTQQVIPQLGIQQQGMQYQGMQQPGLQQQGLQQQGQQSYIQGFSNTGLGQQFGYNPSH